MSIDKLSNEYKKARAKSDERGAGRIIGCREDKKTVLCTDCNNIQGSRRCIIDSRNSTFIREQIR